MKDSRSNLYPRASTFLFVSSLHSISIFLSLYLSFLFNPREQSAAEAKTTELSSTLIRDRSALTALTMPFDPSNRPVASDRGGLPLGRLCQKFQREYYPIRITPSRRGELL